MEIPKIYRETRARVEFVGYVKKDERSGFVYFKYPGGEIPYINEEDFLTRLVRKGFGDEEIEKIIDLLISAVSSETSITIGEVSKSMV